MSPEHDIMRLARKYSMTRHAEFSRTRSEGASKGGRYLVVSNLMDPTLANHKVGVILTRKIGNAVTRNRIRRRIHAILAKHLHCIDSSNGYRYIVTVSRWRAPEASTAQLEADWLKQARHLGILKSTVPKPAKNPHDEA